VSGITTGHHSGILQGPNHRLTCELCS